jgi:hypothetical protein
MDMTPPEVMHNGMALNHDRTVAFYCNCEEKYRVAKSPVEDPPSDEPSIPATTPAAYRRRFGF